ncbi:DNA internalization-related competence protein ComEC/Rec2 [Gammaproteobacteria bacterium]|nr:DNA internalization-related competence protein ComEC/Rec2 [Gammaproteobacteria bacterium]
MRSWMIAFSLGIFICGFIPQLPQGLLHYCLLMIPLLAFRVSCLRLPGALTLGMCWFLLWAQAGVKQLLPSELETKDIWIRGNIVSLPQQTERSQRFVFELSQLCPYPELEQCNFTNNSSTERRILVNLYQPQEIVPGQYWQFKVRLKRPHGFANPGGFDYEAWLLQQKISATGYIRADTNNVLLLENTQLFSFEKLRLQFRKRFEGLFNDSNYLRNAGLIKALSIGDRYSITDREWALFTASGTNHLIVISGLHVGLVTLLVYRVSVLLLSCFTPVLLCIPAQRSGAVCAALAAFFYVGLAGFSLPAQRAFIMVAVFMLGQFLYRQTTISNSFCLALAVVLLVEPLAPQSAGFWLSFGAVAVLILLSNKLNPGGEQLSWWQQGSLLLQTQGWLFIGLLPLMLLFFQQVSLLAPLINLIAIPFISLLVVPLCLLGLVTVWWLPGLSRWLFQVADYLLSLFKSGLELATQSSVNTVLELPALTLSGLLLLILGVYLLLVVSNRSIKLLAVVCLLLLALTEEFNQGAVLSQGEIQLTMLDVGQGLALVLSTKDHHLIYDVGPAYSPRFNAGSGVLVPFIRSQNLPVIDTVVISHGDNDHAGGLPEVLRRYPQAEYRSADISMFPATVQAEPCQAGNSWRWNGVEFEFLHPDGQSYSSNNSSCVLKITTGAYSVLISGDIEKSVERRLLQSSQHKLKANILIAPHHGSNTSSTEAFIDAVAADYVLFSSGYLNRFRHPHPFVLSRYAKTDTVMLNTAEEGAITLHISPEDGIQPPLAYRRQRQRYWSLPAH